MFDPKRVSKFAFKECNDYDSEGPSWSFTEPKMIRFLDALVADCKKSPVAWQTRVNFTNPQSSIQGWQEWKFCNHEEYVNTLYWIDRGYIVYQARELFTF